MWVLRFYVRVRIAARFDSSAKRIQRAYRSHTEVQFWKRHLAATVLAMWFRRVLFIDRCRQRILRALETRRAAQVKQLSCALMLRFLDRIVVRRGWDGLRMHALVERWRDERRVNRLRGLGPVYGPDGKLKVQLVFSSEGDEVLGARDEMLEQVNAMEVVLRANYARPLTALLSDGGLGCEAGDTIDSLVGMGPGLGSDVGPKLDTSWDYAYAYRYEGLRLTNPRRVRRRKSWAERRLCEMRDKRAAEAALQAARLDAQQRLSDAYNEAASGRLSQLNVSAVAAQGVAAPAAFQIQSSSQALVRAPHGAARQSPPNLAAAGAREEAAALHRLPTLPHRPRRNSFDLVGLARINPDTPQYDDGWETCDSEDEELQEAFGFFDDEGRDSESKVGAGAGARANGNFHAAGGAAALPLHLLPPPVPAELGAASTFRLLDAADGERDLAELASIDADFRRQEAREVAETKENTAPQLSASSSGGFRGTALSLQQRPGARPESAMERRIRRTRDFYLRKLARVHVYTASAGVDLARRRKQLYDENVREQQLRFARDAYETLHGEGTSAGTYGFLHKTRMFSARLSPLTTPFPSVSFAPSPCYS
jgi:hypothetical protein